LSLIILISSNDLNTFPMEDRCLDKCTKRGEAIVRVPLNLGMLFSEERALLSRDILKEIDKLRRG